MVALPLLTLAALPARACSIDTSNLLTITRPATGDGPLAGIIGMTCPRTPPAGWEWLCPSCAPGIDVWDLTCQQNEMTSCPFPIHRIRTKHRQRHLPLGV